MKVTYEERGGTVYRIVEYPNGGKTEEALDERIETIRIDNETVVDVVYVFDMEEGRYIELSRTERREPFPPPELDQITQLQLAIAELAETYERDMTDIQLALAELAEIVTGGGE